MPYENVLCLRLCKAVNVAAVDITVTVQIQSQTAHRVYRHPVIGRPPGIVGIVDVAPFASHDHLIDAYGIARRNYYYALADRRPASRKYARRRDGGKGGWIVRAECFMAARYCYSNAQHSERVRAWD